MVSAAIVAITSDAALYREWLGPIQTAIDSIRKGLPAALPADADPAESASIETQLKRRANALLDRLPGLYRDMQTGALEAHLVTAMAAGQLNGRAERLHTLGDNITLAERADFVTAPITVDDAVVWLAHQPNLPTTLKASELATLLPAPLKAQAFFSAQVSSANILQSLHETCTQVASGNLGYGEGLKQLAEFLAREGYGIPKPGTAADSNLEDIASIARLKLILRQNVAMTHAVGQRQVSENAGVMERWPNYRYVANTDRHAQFDGLILPKTDPFWDTHYPPWDYGCHCLVLDEAGQPNGQSAGFQTEDSGAQTGKLSLPSGQALEILPPESGFVFASRPATAFGQVDFSLIADPTMRAAAEALAAKRAVELGLSPA